LMVWKMAEQSAWRLVAWKAETTAEPKEMTPAVRSVVRWAALSEQRSVDSKGPHLVASMVAQRAEPRADSKVSQKADWTAEHSVVHLEQQRAAWSVSEMVASKAGSRENSRAVQTGSCWAGLKAARWAILLVPAMAANWAAPMVEHWVVHLAEQMAAESGHLLVGMLAALTAAEKADLRAFVTVARLVDQKVGLWAALRAGMTADWLVAHSVSPTVDHWAVHSVWTTAESLDSQLVELRVVLLAFA